MKIYKPHIKQHPSDSAEFILQAYLISFQWLFTQNIQKDTFFLYIFLNIQNSYLLYELSIPEHCLKGGMDTQFTNKEGRKKGHFHEGLYLCTILVEDKFLPFLWNQSPPFFLFFFAVVFWWFFFKSCLSSLFNFCKYNLFRIYNVSFFFLIDFFQSCSTLITENIFLKWATEIHNPSTTWLPQTSYNFFTFCLTRSLAWLIYLFFCTPNYFENVQHLYLPSINSHFGFI